MAVNNNQPGQGKGKKKKETRGRKKKPVLTPKQLKFCNEYLADLNGSASAIRAGYSSKGSNTAASLLLSNINIQNKIQELQAQLQKKLKITPESVIAELAKIGFSNIQDFVNGNNSILELKQLDRDLTASVSSVETDIIEHCSHDGVPGYTKTTTKIKLHDKKGALVDLGRHLGIFEKDNKQRKQEEATPQQLMDIVEQIKSLKK